MSIFSKKESQKIPADKRDILDDFDFSVLFQEPEDAGILKQFAPYFGILAMLFSFISMIILIVKK